MYSEYLDRALDSLVSIGRESIPDRVEKFAGLKAEMQDYAARRVNEGIRPMSYLYDDFQLPAVAEMISLIAEASLLCGFKEIDWNDPAQLAAADDVDAVRMRIALLCCFTIIVNPNFREEDLVHLFSASLDVYREDVRNRMGQFWNDGERWKDAFAGCLFVK